MKKKNKKNLLNVSWKQKILLIIPTVLIILCLSYLTTIILFGDEVWFKSLFSKDNYQHKNQPTEVEKDLIETDTSETNNEVVEKENEIITPTKKQNNINTTTKTQTEPEVIVIPAITSNISIIGGTSDFTLEKSGTNMIVRGRVVDASETPQWTIAFRIKASTTVTESQLSNFQYLYYTTPDANGVVKTKNYTNRVLLYLEHDANGLPYFEVTQKFMNNDKISYEINWGDNRPTKYTIFFNLEVIESETSNTSSITSTIS